MRKWWGSSQKASIYIYVSALCLCFLNCDCYQLSFPWPSISSQQVPQCRTGTRKPYKRSCVLLCFQHATFTMAWKIFLVETGDGRNLSSWSALSRELFHCTSLLNNNNKNPLLSQCFCSNPGLLPPSHSHRESFHRVRLSFLLISQRLRPFGRQYHSEADVGWNTRPQTQLTFPRITRL